MRIEFAGEVTEIRKSKYVKSGYKSEVTWSTGPYSTEDIDVPVRMELGTKVRVIVTDEPDAAAADVSGYSDAKPDSIEPTLVTADETEA